MAKRKPTPKPTSAPSAVPTAILGLVTRLCENRDAAKLIITHALIGTNSHSPLSRLMKNAEKVLIAADKNQEVYDLDGALSIGIIASITSTPTPTPKPAVKSSSPHSPVRKEKKPYWIKVVSSYNPAQPNGYGVKGRFVSIEEVAKLPMGALMVVQTTNKKKHKMITIRKAKTGSSYAATAEFADLPITSGITIPETKIVARPDNYHMLFATLDAAGIPKVRLPIPF